MGKDLRLDNIDSGGVVLEQLQLPSGISRSAELVDPLVEKAIDIPVVSYDGIDICRVSLRLARIVPDGLDQTLNELGSCKLRWLWVLQPGQVVEQRDSS